MAQNDARNLGLAYGIKKKCFIWINIAIFDQKWRFWSILSVVVVVFDLLLLDMAATSGHIMV